MRTRRPKALLVGAASILLGLGIGISVPAAASGSAGSTAASTARHPGHHPGRHHGPKDAAPRMQHIFVIMMENTSYSDLLDPSNTNTQFIQNIASTYGLETNYYGVTHTSLPNYVAATSGNTWGSNSDDEAQADQGYFNHTSLVDQFRAAHISWRGYMESMPSAGYTSNYGDCTNGTTPDPTCTAGGDTSTALYVRKHNPFMQYPEVFNNSRLANQVVPLTQLSTDLQSGKVPDFVWISPNICNDMHGGAPQCPYPNSPTDSNQAQLYKDGNDFLQTWVTAIMQSKAWTGNSAIFVTWDEGGYEDSAPYGPSDNSGCCDSPVIPATPPNPSTGGGGDLAGGTLYGGGHVPMIVIARHGARGATDSQPTNHYSLLQTIEANWHLPFLGNASDTLNVTSLAPLLKQ